MNIIKLISGLSISLGIVFYLFWGLRFGVWADIGIYSVTIFFIFLGFLGMLYSFKFKNNINKEKIRNNSDKETNNKILKNQTSEEKYNSLKEDLKTVNDKIRTLTDRLTKDTISSDAYKTAIDNLEKEKKDIEEELWQLRNELFKDDYEKPF